MFVKKPICDPKEGSMEASNQVRRTNTYVTWTEQMLIAEKHLKNSDVSGHIRDQKTPVPAPRRLQSMIELTPRDNIYESVDETQDFNVESKKINIGFLGNSDSDDSDASGKKNTLYDLD